MRQAQAAVVIEKMLDEARAEAILGLSPHMMANTLVAGVCHTSPGLLSEVPSKFTLAIAALSFGIGMPKTDDDMRAVFSDCVFQVQEHIRGKGTELGLRQVDIRLMEWAERARASRLKVK